MISTRCDGLARQIVGIHPRQGQPIIKIQIRNAGFHDKSQLALTTSQELKERVIEATIGKAHGPLVLCDAQLLQEIKRSIDFNNLRLRRNMIQPEMSISMTADVHSVAPQAGDL